MTADIPTVAPKPAQRAAAGRKPRAKKPADPAAMSPADLVAGPCALPDAPLAMPQQVIERAHRTAAPSASASVGI
ncbi:hypothetical protein [Paenirhodobacter sp.]|uniref:hypothetical protein n=1 Tax=Paenirhodobacter sp. TaxID=1965326 RepID=UPI003B41D06C